MRWKCRLVNSSLEHVCQMLQRIPEACIEHTVEQFRNRHTAKESAVAEEKHFFILKADAKVEYKMAAVAQMLRWAEAAFGEGTIAGIKKANGKLPYGLFATYVRSHAKLKKACGLMAGVTADTKYYRNMLARYTTALKLFLREGLSVTKEETESAVADNDAESAVADNAAQLAVADEVPESAVAENGPGSAVVKFTPYAVSPFIKYRTKKTRTGSQYFRKNVGFVRKHMRRRCLGGGRKRVCFQVAELTMDWYSIVRHSVDTKIMCRFPKQVLLMKAKQFQEDYYVACLKHGVEPERVEINGGWLNRLLGEYRISSRVPNRKFKVPRPVLAERLKIFWVGLACIRALILLEKGYDPEMQNIDQSPEHENEAGSAATNTLAIMGAPTVPLVENHAATRQRWSLNTVTDSNGQTRIERVRRSAHAAEKRAAIAHARGWGNERVIQAPAARAHAVEQRAAIAHARGWGDRGNGGTGLQLELLRWWQRWRNAYTTPAIRREEASRMLAQALDNGAGQ